MDSPASLQEPLGQEVSDGGTSTGDVQERMMRVKVLYTFDDQNKTNCLARLPNPLAVTVVALDQSTQIGVVELKTCIEAIVAASPEIIAKLEHDYTVYAYDYSEYETPLVGQGMLSRVLASTSPTPNAPASESRTMITGRVCKNIMGLFSSGGVKETLEVKLKLVPVPQCSQGEYLRNMEMYRNATRPVQADPRQNIGSIESLHDLLSQGQSPMEEDWNTGLGISGSSRGGSPAPSHHSLPRGNDFLPSRPDSRMSMRQSHGGEVIDESGYDEGPARKRARLMSTEWYGRGSFGGKSDSLRVAASTSGSLRDFRPSSYVANSSAGNEQYPRAPTPRPFEKRATLQRTSSLGSILRRQSTSFDFQSPYPPSEGNTPLSDAVSPEEQARLDEFSPQSSDLPSSPPAYAFNDEAVMPSSPGLPELPPAALSGMRDGDVDSIEKDEIEKAQTPRMSNAERSARDRIKRQEERNKALIEKNNSFAWISEAPGPAELLPRTHSVKNQDKARNSAPALPSEKLSKTKTASAAPPTPLPTSEGVQYESTFNPNFSWLPPPVPVPPAQPTPPPSEPNLHPATTLHRSDSAPAAIQAPANNEAPQTTNTGPMSGKISLPPRTTTQGTWTNKRAIPRAQSVVADGSSDVEPESSAESNPLARKRGQKRGSANTRQKKRINDNLQKDVAAGKAPRICYNCGDPSPTTWRSSWVRTYEGSATDIEVGVNGIHMVETVKKNDQGETTSYRVYKQWTALTVEEKKGGPNGPVQEYVLCNACGNYVRLRGQHRPPVFWDKALQKPPADKKKNRPSKAPSVQPVHPQSDVYIDTMAPFSSDFLQDLSTMVYTDPVTTGEFGFSDLADFESAPVPQAPHAPNAGAGQQNSLFDFTAVNSNWDVGADSGLHRAIEASPARAMFTASQEIPFEIDPDLTSKPTNRLLFPSPRKEGQFKSLDGAQTSPTGSPAEQVAEQRTELVNGTNETPDEPDLSKAAQTISHPRSADSNADTDTADKENQPPPIDEHDDLAHLFEELPHKTPGRPSPSSKFMAGLLKTPTPSSKRTRRSTPRTGSQRSHLSPVHNPLLNTPSRITRSASKALKALTPARGTENLEAVSADPTTFMTPMTAHLHKLLTDGLTSPPHHTSDANIDFSDYLNGTDYGFTDLPMPSSPPRIGETTSAGVEEGSFDFGTMPDFGIWEDATAEQEKENIDRAETTKPEDKKDNEGVVECAST